MDTDGDLLHKAIAVQHFLAQREQDLDDEEQRILVREREDKQRRQDADRRAEEENDEEEEAAAELKRRRCHDLLVQEPALDPIDEPSVQDLARAHVGSSVFIQEVRKLTPLVPTIGRGMSEANDDASRKRRDLTYPPDAGGVYGHLCSIPAAGGIDGFRQRTGFSRDEFDDFYAEQGGDRGRLFEESRNHLGEFTEEENKARRRIRGTMPDRDRVICWLEVLRKDATFADQEAKYGPSKATFHNDFKWMTIAAAGLQFLHEEIKWPGGEERSSHGAFFEEWGHPEFRKVVYIADGTKSMMRNPSKVGKGLPEPHDDVHNMHYSRNKGLGWSHIVYCNVRGKIIKVDTAKGCFSDRAAHCASAVYLQADALLSDGETGMGDGNYRGPARSGDNVTQMCTPYQNNGNLTPAQKSFNSRQRRFRVVVENTIGQIKKWQVVGSGAFRHERDFEVTVFDVCARLTARVMRVRDKYPRSADWVANQITDWEAKLGIFLWVDAEDPGSYLIHDRGEDLVYNNWQDGDATLLQNRWEEIWDMHGV